MGWEHRAATGDESGSCDHLEGMTGSRRSEEAEGEGVFKGQEQQQSPCRRSSGSAPPVHHNISPGCRENGAPFKANSKLDRQGPRGPHRMMTHHVPYTAMTHIPHARNLLPGAPAETARSWGGLGGAPALVIQVQHVLQGKAPWSQLCSDMVIYETYTHTDRQKLCGPSSCL